MIGGTKNKGQRDYFSPPTPICTSQGKVLGYTTLTELAS